MARSERESFAKVLKMDNINSSFNTKFVQTHLSQGSFPGLWTELVHSSWMHSTSNINLYKSGTVLLLDEATKTNSMLCIYQRISYSFLLGVFAKFIKETIRFIVPIRLSICLSVRMEQLASHWTVYHEIWYLTTFRNSVTKIQVSLQSDKNDGYFTWRHVSFMVMPLWILLRILVPTCFRQKLERKSKHTF
jgi:hypothetical protein